MQPAQIKAAIAGRLKMTERCLAAAALLKQEAGVSEHILRTSLSGRAWYKLRRISAPEGRTRKQLYILAHECAHIALQHLDKPVHVRETEAEQWAHEALRRHSLAVPKSMTARARQYVAYKINRALKRGAKHIDPRAARFAEGKAPQLKPEALDRWCREQGKTEESLRRLLRIRTAQFIRLEDGDAGLSRWIGVCLGCSVPEAARVLRWAGLHAGRSTPPTPYIPEL